MSTSDIRNLDKLVLVNLDIDIWSGQAKLQASDLKRISVEDLPPESLASLGSKRLCNREHLKVFQKLKARAVRAVLERGRPFLGGYAYPVKFVKDLEVKLLTIEQEYLTAKNNFLGIYEDAVKAWMTENPEYAEAIERGALTRDEVAERLQFGFQLINVTPTESLEAQKRLRKSVNGLGDQLVEEMAEKANEFFEKYLVGQQAVSTQTKRTLLNMRDKVAGMCFLNSRLQPMQQLLDTMIRGYASFQGQKRVEGEEFFRILAATLILGDREKLDRYTKGELSLESLMPAMSEQTAEEAEEPETQEQEENEEETTGNNEANSFGQDGDFFF